jgi:hypothetical protein
MNSIEESMLRSHALSRLPSASDYHSSSSSSSSDVNAHVPSDSDDDDDGEAKNNDDENEHAVDDHDVLDLLVRTASDDTNNAWIKATAKTTKRSKETSACHSIATSYRNVVEFYFLAEKPTLSTFVDALSVAADTQEEAVQIISSRLSSSSSPSDRGSSKRSRTATSRSSGRTRKNADDDNRNEAPPSTQPDPSSQASTQPIKDD